MNTTQPAQPPSQLILGASEALSQARDLLARPVPQNLDLACTPLSMAVAQVSELKEVLTVSPSRDLIALLAGLRHEIHLVSRLLDNAASYHVNLMQSMVEASGTQVQVDACAKPPRHLSVDA